jgi:EAL and modified HD-GYP domain-containing signal transduction protein
MNDFFVGRQPIYNRKLEVVAYELLFRDSEANRAAFVDGDQATSRLLHDTFLETGLDAIVHDKMAFINFTRDFVLGDSAAIFPANRVVVEILEDVVVDAALLEAVRTLSAQGYTIALDDCICHPDMMPLVALADIIKLDVLALDGDTLQHNVQTLRQYNVQLLAEKVETRATFTSCCELGFDYFQGYFLSKPDVVKGQRSPSSRLAPLLLLAKLQDPAVEFRDLEEIVARDVSLSYKLLRVVNAAIYGLSKKVESIHQALFLLGTRSISRWLSVILLANISDKPHDVMTTSLVRAKMCELLGEAMERKEKDVFFTVGLFSALDALLDTPLPDVLASLPLADEVIRALLAYEGILGETLSCVVAYEHGNWQEIGCGDLSQRTIIEAYLQAIAWADGIAAQLGAPQ